jgi:hypothetical protein
MASETTRSAGFSRGNAVVGGQSSVRQVSDQRRNGVGHQPWRGGHHLAALLGGDDESLEVVDEPLVDAAELLVEPVIQRVGVAAMSSSRRRDLSWSLTAGRLRPRLP